MTAMSDFLELKVLDHVLGTTAYTQPTSVFIGLSTGTFADDNSGTEITGNGYARQAVTFNAASGGTATSSATVTFPTATGTWGLIQFFGIFDAASGGNLLLHGALSSSKNITTGDVIRMNAGDVTVNAT
tara:strand:+ start:268 stop:654 length:387 start_codon:yes stop_codon:yes gene_type:complete